MNISSSFDFWISSSIGIIKLANFMFVAFLSLFTIIDPIGNVPIFLSLTSKSPEAKSRIAFRAVTVAFAIFVAIIISGSLIFNFLGISMAALKISGGIIIFLYALDMLRGEDTTDDASAYDTKKDIAIIPLAIPLLAGPGSITTVIVLSSRIDNITGYFILTLMCALIMMLTWLIFARSEAIHKLLGERGITITNKIMGLLIAAVAVQFVLDGIIDIWPRAAI